ncbi:energy transducer TonB [Dysgonomonas sp. 511]|uniref:energy transducer TonB n=1 Tax=Dysgonomonas sp. 511 TaxID=2302930 RepID=UPI0013D81485|nr:energy transducer TonB [Dysgonomonas sp. 511]NDV77655.1 energy transducer TonB [Dysgonomonas sp. 511]
MKKLFLFFALLPLSIPLFSQEEPFVFIDHEVAPSFPGGQTAMSEFINERLIYPQSALNDGIEGRVTVRFLVKKTGNLDKIALIRGIHPECDSLALQIVRAMPKWNPGSMRGDAKVDVWFTLPIIFKLPYKMVDREKVFVAPDVYASFPGGVDSMKSFIHQNLRWPDDGGCFQGRVVVRFIVTEEGKLVAPEVIRSITPGADKEALRVISLMPDWTPAKQNGVNVKMRYVIPVAFHTER